MNRHDYMRGDSGASLVEVLVAIGLFGLLSSLLLGFALNTSRVTEDTRQFANLSEDSRLAMERLSRELRQANEITAVQLPASPGDATVATKLTIWIDFNGNREKDDDAYNPEFLTYEWDPSTKLLTLQANQSGGTPPLLSSIVSAFTIGLYSSDWEYDTDSDGRSSWSELALVGNRLNRIDVVRISLTVLDGQHEQHYSTEVDMRNRNLN